MFLRTDNDWWLMISLLDVTAVNVVSLLQTLSFHCKHKEKWLHVAHVHALESTPLAGHLLGPTWDQQPKGKLCSSRPLPSFYLQHFLPSTQAPLTNSHMGSITHCTKPRALISHRQQNQPPTSLLFLIKSNTSGSSLEVTLEQAHHLLPPIQRPDTSCSGRGTYTPMCWKTDIYLFFVCSCAWIIDPRSGCNLWKPYFSTALSKESE